MKNKIKAFTDQKIDEAVTDVRATDWSNPLIYGNLLAQTYYYICHTTRILASAGARFPLAQQPLHNQCLRHAAEEKNHERLSLGDLESIGHSLRDFPEMAPTKSMYRSAYYMIEHESPITVLGYAYFLEKLAVHGGPPLLEAVLAAYGKKSAKHLLVHTSEDPEHIVTVEAMLEKLNEADQAHVLEAVATTAFEFAQVMTEIKRVAGVRAA